MAARHCFFFRNSIPHFAPNASDVCNADVEVTAANTVLSRYVFCIAAIYVRCRSSAAMAADLVRALVDRFQGPIWCRDFNAHHHLWGDKRDDPQDRLLADAFENCGLAIGNDGSPTFFPPTIVL